MFQAGAVTECAAALLSFRYPSFKDIRVSNFLGSRTYRLFTGEKVTFFKCLHWGNSISDRNISYCQLLPRLRTKTWMHGPYVVVLSYFVSVKFIQYWLQNHNATVKTTTRTEHSSPRIQCKSVKYIAKAGLTTRGGFVSVGLCEEN